VEKTDIRMIGKAHYEIDKVMYWELYNQSLCSALVDRAGEDIEIPSEAQDYWMGEVDHDDINFIVTLYYNADEIQS